ncbi:hypothetical protein G5T42_17015 [Microbacterium sp. 4R-513]|uniref:glycoside hydrolase family 38 N-terminal domain-containing protein n=1 Tax=Microbacterium sp. 4R-513 TaxID=2567934 RepID=UPI0013E17B5A|nr:hypothetical protein [Microbacterium sp. 4R-513]QIG40961.1 hypothetical protein G5T42_17015 [Microbacterium sp. 4R-513]
MAEPHHCHVVTHVHWDREWYRPFEAYRTRLVELVDQVCRQLDAETIATFHLDGQTITLRDVADLRPDLIDRIRRHVRAGRLTIGPWHVLADNQLVSGESLVRNLLAARRHGAAVGELTGIGYSPDAFGHPADLPRVLAGFGIGTALVWRGAPPELAEFRWRSPDGSEVYAVNQCYYEVDVLWDEEGRAGRLEAFLDRERARRDEGPWLLMNGADHVAPRDTTPALDNLSPKDALLTESSLDAFFRDLRGARPSPAVVDGELRHAGGPGSFLLPGTLSSRIYLKQQNAAAEALLERLVEPLLAAEALATDASSPVAAVASPVVDGTTTGHLQHAWELVLENAPHDSICGCSVDEVHRENEVRSERVMQLGHQLARRALLRAGFDTRVHGAPATDRTRIAVHLPLAGSREALPAVVDIVIAPDRTVAGLEAPDGTEVPVEVEDLGTSMSFEADLDLLPDSVLARRQRLRFLADAVAAGETGVYTVRLGARDPEPVPTDTVPLGSAIALPGGLTVSIADDASFTVADAGSGIRYERLGRLADGGDRGDTYNYDPPADDAMIAPVARPRVEVRHSPVRTVVRWRATLDLPVSLDATRDARSAETVATVLDFELARWNGRDEVDWSVAFVNGARDHRLRAHFPIADEARSWRSGQHFSFLDRPFGPIAGEFPTDRNREAEIGTHPAHGYASAGSLGLLFDHVSEVQGVGPREEPAELAVTILRSTGWLSRFDLRSRTTGAGPMLATPEAQVLRPMSARIGLRFGAAASDAFALAGAADSRRAAPLAAQLREGTLVPAPKTAPVTVEGAIVTAFKPADDGEGAVLRLANPSPHARTARLRLGPGLGATAVRFDETALDGTLGAYAEGMFSTIDIALPAQATASVRVTAR